MIVPVSPERSPLRVRTLLALISPVVPVIALADGEAAGAVRSGEEDAGVGAEGNRAAGIGARAGDIQHHSRGNAERLTGSDCRGKRASALDRVNVDRICHTRRRSHSDVRPRGGEVSRVTGVRRESGRGIVSEEIGRADDARQDSGRVCGRHRAVDKELARRAERGGGDLERGTRCQRQVASSRSESRSRRRVRSQGDVVMATDEVQVAEGLARRGSG